MIIGVTKETYHGENRVALTPAMVSPFVKKGHTVLVESRAGTASGFLDPDYQEKGATIKNRPEIFEAADIILQVRGYGANRDAGASDLDLMRSGQSIIAFFDPLSEPGAIQEIAKRQVNAFSMELIPRITRAQSMDALSSMATISGYKAVLIAANHLPKMFPMMMTAAGTISPAKVFVIGAGVAGLQAIASSRRLGAVVQGYDVRPAVKEQVQSLGAEFVEIAIESSDSEDKGGYAKEMDTEFYRRQQDLMTRVVADNDVVITTAAIPGKKAPILITRGMVEGMRPGSVIVDIAAERGGNCELTRPGETVVQHGVTIVGPLNLPASIPFHASQMYAKNIATFLTHIMKDGQLTIAYDDEIVSGTLLTQNGNVVHPQVKALIS